MIWFISDTHYSHANIVRGVSKWGDKSGCRDFNTLEAHDEWLVGMINEKVGITDTLYHLGDWSFGGKNKITEFRNKLHCSCIIVIPGNHDHHLSHADARQTGLNVEDKYVEFNYKGLQLVLCHYPIESWNNMERGARHLHGHTHGQLPVKSGRIDVGIDGIGLISLDEIASLPLPTDQRHSTIHGGNKFA